MGKNSEQRRAEKVRAYAAEHGMSYQQALEKLRQTPPDPVTSPSQVSVSASWMTPSVEEGAFLEDLRLAIPEGLPRMAGAHIAKVVEDFGASRDVVQPYDEDRDLTLLDHAEVRTVLIGGRMPGRKAMALVKAGEAMLDVGEDGEDHGDGIVVVFPTEYTLHSHNMVAMIGMQPEPQGWEHSWEHGAYEEDPHPWNGRAF